MVRVTETTAHSSLAGLSITRTTDVAKSVAIRVAAVRDPRKDHEAFGIVHRVDEAVIANSDAEVISASKLHCAGRPRVRRQAIDCGCNPIGDRPTESAVRLDRLRVKADVVMLGRTYSRSFDQGTAWSTSSRACSAARLSSRYSARSTIARY